MTGLPLPKYANDVFLSKNFKLQTRQQESKLYINCIFLGGGNNELNERVWK